MMTAQCLPVPMVGHYQQAIRIKSFSELYNSHKIEYYKYTFTFKASSQSQVQ